MRSSIFTLMDFLGAAYIGRVFHRKRLTILLYHGVAPQIAQGIYNYRGKFIEPSAFERQIAYFAKKYTILGLAEGIERLRANTLPKNALAITFDDGYRNFYEYAYPVLKKYRAPATMFLATDFVVRNTPLWVDRLEYAIGALPGSHRDRVARDTVLRAQLKMLAPTERESRLREIEREANVSFDDFSGTRHVYAPLTVNEIRELAQAGITFGAHTMSHPILAHCESAEQRRELVESVQEVRKLAGDVSPVFAYPNGQPGDWNADTISALQEAGFSSALTTIEGTNAKATPLTALRRIAMDKTTHHGFASIASGVRLFLRTIKQYVR